MGDISGSGKVVGALLWTLLVSLVLCIIAFCTINWQQFTQVYPESSTTNRTVEVHVGLWDVCHCGLQKEYWHDNGKIQARLRAHVQIYTFRLLLIYARARTHASILVDPNMASVSHALINTYKRISHTHTHACARAHARAHTRTPRMHTHTHTHTHTHLCIRRLIKT